MHYNKNFKAWLEYVSKLNIYQPHIHTNGKMYYGGAGISTRISTDEGLANFFGEQELGRIVFGFSDYYNGELMRLGEFDTFLNLDVAGVGEDLRNIYRAFANIANEPELRQMLDNIENSLPNQQDKNEFSIQRGYMECSNYVINNTIINCPIKPVW